MREYEGRTVRPWLAGAAAWIAWAVASPAAAQTRAGCDLGEVDAEIASANADRRAGRGLRAVDRLSALYARCPSPRVHGQWGLAAQGVTRWRDAYTHLRAALESSSDPWVQSRRGVLEQALREVSERLPRLSPQCNVPGAELWVDGVAVGTLPLPEPHVLPQGVATLEVRATGHQSQQRAVSLPENTVFRELFTLVPTAVAVATVATATTRAPAATMVLPPDQPEARGGTQRILGWTFLGVAAAGIGVGIWGTVARNNEVDAFNADPGCQTVSQRETSDCVSAQARIDAFVPAMVAGYAVGGAAAIASVILLVTAPSSSPRRASGCFPGVGSVQCSIDF